MPRLRTSSSSRFVCCFVSLTQAILFFVLLLLRADMMQSSFMFVSAWEFDIIPRTGRLITRRSPADPWGTVCDDKFSHDTVRGICRITGKNSNPTHVWFYTEGSGTGNVWLTDVTCAPTVTDFASCAFNTSYPNSVACAHSEDVGIFCFPWTFERDSNTKTLMVKPGNVSNPISVPYGTVCAPSGTPPSRETAVALCRALGIDNVPITVAKAFIVGPDAAKNAGAAAAIYVSSVSCAESASRLEECQMDYVPARQPPGTACTQLTNVGLTCEKQPPFPNPGALWQISVPPTPGEPLLVRPNSTAPWGTCCSDGMTNETALTVCKMWMKTQSDISEAAINRVAVTWTTSLVSARSNPNAQIYIDELSCPTTAVSLSNCQYVFSDAGQRRHDCGHSDDTVLYCDDWHPSVDPGTLRLRLRPTEKMPPPPSPSSSSSSSSSMSSELGTVCGDGFGINEARTFCRMLGHEDRPDTTFFAAGTVTSGPIYLASVRCPAEARHIRECTYTRSPKPFPQTCTHLLDISLDCNGTLATPAPDRPGMFTSEIIIAIVVPLIIVLLGVVFYCVRWLTDKQEKQRAEAADMLVNRSPSSQALTGMTSMIVSPSHRNSVAPPRGSSTKVDSTPLFHRPSQPVTFDNARDKTATTGNSIADILNRGRNGGRDLTSPDRMRPNFGDDDGESYRETPKRLQTIRGNVAPPLPPRAGAAAVSNPFGRASPHTRNETPKRNLISARADMFSDL